MANFNENHIPDLLKAPLYKRQAHDGLMGGRSLNQAELDRLMSLGINPTSLFKPQVHMTTVNRVVFYGEHFKFANKGDARAQQVVTMGLIGDAGLSDVVAWQPSSGRLATMQGLGAALGECLVKHHVDDHSLALAVFRSPLDWFRADCRGVVIVHHCIANELLCAVQELLAEDEAHRLELRKMFLDDEPHPRILLRNQANESEKAA